MNLASLMAARAEAGEPVRVGVIGAGKFATMFFNRAPHVAGLHVVAVADLRPETARSNLAFAGWPEERFTARSLDDAAKGGDTHVTEDAMAVIRHPAVEIVIEITGSPTAAVDHCLAAFEAGKHVINVTVEADAFCGPAIAEEAHKAGVIYSMAYGDQPALACELVDWARSCGFTVTAAGRGHKWMPHYRRSTPETVWDHWGLTREQAERGRLNPKMFNAFLDGSKPAIECAATANVTGLEAPSEGLAFPSGSVDDIPALMRPGSAGGVLEKAGLVETISCLDADSEPIPYDIRQGMWVSFEGDSDYLRNCFEEYGMLSSPDRSHGAMYRRTHLIGLELPVSIASIAIRGEPTGSPLAWNADCVAIAKRDLKAGEVLDGEGGATVSGGLRPARMSVEAGLLPLGLADGPVLMRDVADGAPVRYDDVTLDATTAAARLRARMEQRLGRS